MIDQRYSRAAFESLRSSAERGILARELGDELRAHIAGAPSPENGLSAGLARLRLIGHVLDAVAEEGERVVLSGDPAGDAPTGLEIELHEGQLIEVRYRRRSV
jgi:hypothetical protein